MSQQWRIRWSETPSEREGAWRRSATCARAEDSREGGRLRPGHWANRRAAARGPVVPETATARDHQRDGGHATESAAGAMRRVKAISPPSRRRGDAAAGGACAVRSKPAQGDQVTRGASAKVTSCQKQRATKVTGDGPTDRRPSTRSPAHATDRHVKPNDYPVCNATTRPAVRPTLGHATTARPADPPEGRGRARNGRPGAPFVLRSMMLSVLFTIMSPSLDAGRGARGATPSPILPNQKP